MLLHHFCFNFLPFGHIVHILDDVQYSQKAVFSFEKSPNRQNHSSSGFLHSVKKIPPVKFPIPPLWYIQQNRNQKCKGCRNGGIYQNLWQTLSKFNFGHFFNFIILPPFCWGKLNLKKKHCLRKMGNFRLSRVVIRIWGRVLLEGTSKNKQIQLFNSQMYFLVILSPRIWKFSITMVGWNMWGCILEVNSEGLASNWPYVPLPFILLVLTWQLTLSSRKMKLSRKKSGKVTLK